MAETTRVYARTWLRTGNNSHRAFDIKIAECGSKECLTLESVIRNIEEGINALEKLGLEIEDVLVEIFEMDVERDRTFAAIKKSKAFCLRDLKSSLSVIIDQ